MMKRNGALALFGCLCLLFAFTTVGLAQSNPPTSSTGASATPEPPNMRFFQQFVTDAAIVDKQWWGVELRFDKGAVPPFRSADGTMLIGTVAISPLTNLEIGGTAPWIDYSLDNDVRRPGTNRDFGGDSGIGDITVWGKYRFLTGPVSVSAGGELSLPTGSEDQGLGTGEFTPGVFGAVRVKAQDGYFLGSLDVKFYSDATILNIDRSGKTATVVGGGYIWEGFQDWVLSGEITAASERYSGPSSNIGDSSDIRATVGVQYTGLRHSLFRGGVAVGLSDGAPDFELILGYAYHF